MQARAKPTDRWRRLLQDDDVQAAIATELKGRDWRHEFRRQEELPIREHVRAQERKAAAEASVAPKPTLVPKKANWRKKGFSGDATQPTQAHAAWEELFGQLHAPPPSPPLPAANLGSPDASAPSASPTARPAYGSKRPMSTKGRQYQLDKQLEAQERRRVQQMRAMYKERFDMRNLRHREWELAYYRRPTTNTEVDRQRAREKAATARRDAEASKHRSIDSRYAVAQEQAEARAAAAAAAAVSASEEEAPTGAGAPAAPSADPALMHQAVVIEGLIGRPELNGTRGLCESFNAEVSRYHVRLPSGEVVALRGVALTAVTDEAPPVAEAGSASDPHGVSGVGSPSGEPREPSQRDPK